MAVFRVAHTENFTSVDNQYLRDKRINLQAKGLLTIMLSLPNSWNYSVEGLVTFTGHGRTSITTAIKELETYGYIERSQIKEKGKYGGYKYDIFEIPISGYPPTEKTISGDTPQESTKKQKTNKQKTLIVFKPDSNAYKCAEYLDSEICLRLPEKKPVSACDLQKWAAVFDKTNRIDGYSWQTISDVLEFSQENKFWQSTILSPEKFRKQFVTLMAKMDWEDKSQRY